MKAKLNEMDYILDTRFMSSGIKDAKVLVDRLCAMTVKRFEAFEVLARQYTIDVGYLCNRSLTVAQYFAMSELEPMIVQSDMTATENSRPVEQTPLQSELLRLYTTFDDCMGRLFDSLQPKEWMILGDHGHVPMLWRVNLNAALRQAGFQRAQGSAGFKRTIKRVAKLFVPRTMRAKVGHQMIGMVKAVGNDTDWSKTTAFSDMVYPGIYLYDKERFGGQNFDDAKREALTDQIVSKLNDLSEFKKHRFVARPYRRDFKDAPFSHQLPEVWIDTPDSYFFRLYGPLFERNTDYRPIKSLHEVTNDMYTGMKGKHPDLLREPLVGPAHP